MTESGRTAMMLEVARPLAVDLFAGAGGLSLGLEQAGFDVAASVEYDPIHAAVHEYNFPYSTTFCRDVTTMTGDEIREGSSIGSREIEIVAGGPPCQGFSMIGKRALDDPRNALLAEFARLVIELKPRYFLLENVAGLTVGNHRQLLDEVIEMMGSAGYDTLLPYKVLQAADFGTPQSRKRLILMGARQGLTVPQYPKPLCAPRRINGSFPSVTLFPNMLIGPSVADALGDLPDADQFDELLADDYVRANFGNPSAYAAPLRAMVREDDDYSRSRDFPPDVLTSSTRTVHTPVSIQRFAATAPGTTEKVSRFLRLHPDGISNTLRAGTASDRGAYTAPRPIHPTLPRVLTVREAARLHGYPDWFRFHVTKWNGFRQIGNSVPPKLGRAIGSSVLSAEGMTPTKGELTHLGDPALLSFNATEAQRYFGIDHRVIPQRNRKAV
ncbi:MAG: DNA cytosine methyltransferase [Propionibacteriaceae bacterium]|jgi:DNA (cytosine-5)-methyltransferase 1|nr:DNA cytosine methyltransferase [Propionibacteriaceae bacterium]